MSEIIALYSMAAARSQRGAFTPEQQVRFELIASTVLTADIQELKDLLSALLADSEEHAVSN